MHIVVNHLRLSDPFPEAKMDVARDIVDQVVDAGAHAARVAKVDDKHRILILEFASAEDADRIAREVGGPWMREHISPLLADGTERSLGEIIASADAS